MHRRGAGLHSPQKQMTLRRLREWWVGLTQEIFATSLSPWQGLHACTALVDTGSIATLLRSDLILAGSQLNPTVVNLRTVTGELGRRVVVIQVGGLAVKL